MSIDFTASNKDIDCDSILGSSCEPSKQFNLDLFEQLDKSFKEFATIRTLGSNNLTANQLDAITKMERGFLNYSKAFLSQTMIPVNTGPVDENGSRTSIFNPSRKGVY